VILFEQHGNCPGFTYIIFKTVNGNLSRHPGFGYTR
jgi:hypothetical protein